MAAVTMIAMFKVTPEEWPSPMQDLEAALYQAFEEAGQLDDIDYHMRRLQSYKLLAEELQEARLPATQSKHMREQRMGTYAKVLEMANQLLASDMTDSDLFSTVFSTLAEYIHFETDLANVEPHIRISLQYLSNDAVAEAAADFIIAVLLTDAAAKLPTLLRLVADHLVQCSETVQQQLQGDETEAARAVARVATSLGEYHMNILLPLNEPDAVASAHALLNLMLTLAACPGQYPTEEDMSEMTIRFWNQFVDTLASADLPIFDRMTECYANRILDLIGVLCTKLQYPADDETFGKDDKTDFESYRLDWAEVMIYGASMVGEEALEMLTNRLQEAMGRPEPSWQECEGIVCCASAVAKNSKPDLETPGPFLKAMLELPGHPTLSKSSVECVGSFAEWLSLNTAAMHHIVPLLFDPLQSQDTMGVASETLLELCDNGGKVLVSELDPLLTAVEPVLNDANYPCAVRSRCFEAVGCVVKHAEPHIVALYCRRLLDPLQSTLMHACSVPMSDDTVQQLLPTITILRNVSSRLNLDEEMNNENHPLIRMVLECERPIRYFLVDCCMFDTLVKEISLWLLRVYRAAAEAAIHCASLVMEVCIASFSQRPHATILELWSSVFRSHCKVPEMEQSLHESLLQISEISRQALSAGSSDGIDDITSYFETVAKCVRTSAKVAVGDNADFAATLLHWSKINMALPEPFAVRKVVGFLKAVFLRMSACPVLQQTVSDQMEEILQTAFQGVTHIAVRSVVSPLSDVLFQLFSISPDRFMAWLRQELVNAATVPPNVPDQDRQKLIDAIIGARMHNQRFNNAMENFGKLCRKHAAESTVPIVLT
eukprot:TRINITY_DN11868_c1_g1_i1.p1 TRINITY_DN11868_c1_g1~~TRINITY_DN11868_c1_g1_i1.p1  ORF type:complete len:879 (+),score=234.63 TRINITY_DN11868_c1_g1_i1:145-2637(+)